jgi:hypothetical protein
MKESLLASFRRAYEASVPCEIRQRLTLARNPTKWLNLDPRLKQLL